MKKFFTSVSILLSTLLIFISIAAAQDSVKIGYVDMQKAMENSAAGQEATKKLNDTLDGYKSEIQTDKEKIEALKAEIDKQSLLWNEKTRRDKEDELRLMERDYNRMLKDVQDEMKRQESGLSEIILKEILQVIEEIGESEGYTVILEKKSSAILYAPSTINITDQVIKAYDAKKQ